MPGTLVDTNVLLDIFTQDDEWLDWSAAMLDDAAHAGPLCINPIIYAEASAHFSSIEELDVALPVRFVQRLHLPWDAAYLAGEAYLRYKRRGGVRRSPLGDFYIGAHAAVSRLTLLTRDPKRYRAYFPTVRLLAP